MIDCGSHSDKENPVDTIKYLAGNWLAHMKDSGERITLLSVSHPDEDHIRNCERVAKELRPRLLYRRRLEEFPKQSLTAGAVLSVYKELLCDKFRGGGVVDVDWGFERKSFRVPMEILIADRRFASGKLTNNASIVTLLSFAGRRILFGGDLETEAWRWLIYEHPTFLDSVLMGIDFFVASHHGHTSGYPDDLFDLIGVPKMVILSKGKELGGETDVDARYARLGTGYSVKSLSSETFETRYTLTSRKDGRIYIDVQSDGSTSVFRQN